MSPTPSPALARYGPLNTHDLTKCFAIAMMVLDHLGAFVLPEVQALRILGRASFPLFFFLIGYAFTPRITPMLWVYAVVLAVAALVLRGPVLPVNILFSVAVCRVALPWLEQRGMLKSERLVYLWLALLALHPLLMFAWEYGTIALMFAVAGYAVRHARDHRSTGEFLFMCFLVQGALSIISFGSDLLRIVCLLFLMSAMALWMRTYELRPVGGEWSRATIALRWVSVHALGIYFWHLLALRLAGYVLNPQLHQDFKWI